MSDSLEHLVKRRVDIEALPDTAIFRKGYQTFRLLRDTRKCLLALDENLDAAVVGRDEKIRILGESALHQPDVFRVTSPFEFAETMARVDGERSQLSDRSAELKTLLEALETDFQRQLAEKNSEIKTETESESALLTQLDSLSDDEYDVQTMAQAKKRLTASQERRVTLLRERDALTTSCEREIDRLRRGLAEHLELVGHLGARANAVQRDLGRAVLESDLGLPDSPVVTDAQAALDYIHRLRAERFDTLEYLNCIDERPLNLLIKRAIIAFSVTVGLVWVIAY